MSRVIFVFVAVSSKKTRQVASKSRCLCSQDRRARATSGRSRSSARSVFFNGKFMPLKKSPNRAPASRDASFPQSCHDLDQDQVRLPLNYAKQSACMLLEGRNAAPGRHRRSTPGVLPMLKPFDRRTRAYFKAFRCFPARRAGMDSFNDAPTQIFRIRSWHAPAPQLQRRINRRRIAHSPGAWESPRQRSPQISIRAGREPL